MRILDYVTVHDAGRLLNPVLADGQVLGGFAHGAAAALYERHVWDEAGQSDDRLARGLPRTDCARHPCAADRAPFVAVARDRARRQGDRRGQHDERTRLRSRMRSPTLSVATTSSCR